MDYFLIALALIFAGILTFLTKKLDNYSKKAPPSPMAMKFYRKMHWMTPKRYIRWKTRNFKTQIKRWWLKNKKEEITIRVFNEIDKHLRPVCISQVGGFQPSKDLKASWFGNILLNAPGEAWPHSPDKPMSPLVQLNLTEAPYVPERLKDYEMIAVFIDYEFPTMHWDEEKVIKVRLYKSIEELVPLTDRPNFNFCVRPFPLKWQQMTNEGPDYFTAREMTDMSDFDVFEDSIDIYQKRFPCSEKTKLGGYPALIQGNLDFGNDNYLFQIGSEEKASWMWGDSGIAYFGIDNNGHLLFEWQCY